MAGIDAKARLKQAVKRAAMSAGRATSADNTRILTYHSVGERDHEMNVTPKAFAEQMAWLHDHSPVVSLAEAAQDLPGIAITFDDGYQDNLTNAAPILAQYAMPATVFLVTQRMGGILDHDLPFVSSCLRGENHCRLLTWQQAQQLQQLGWTIGGHTQSHARLSALSKSAQGEEITGCMDDLRNHLGDRARPFAYPYGSALDFTPTTQRLVREAGFAYAVSNRYGIVDPAEPWSLRRIWIDRTDTLDTFRGKIDGRLDALRILDAPIGIRTRRALNAILRTA